VPPECKVVLLNGRPRWSLPRGRVLLRALRNAPTQEYLVMIPSSGAVDAPVLVSVHGISRNASEQARVLAAGCEEHGIVLVVPIFTSEQHKDYQRLGRRGRGARADFLLNRCLEEVALLSGVDVTQFRLFGFSGGAQFAHRYAMAHPHRVARAVFAAAGWYTFPDHTQRFPYGIRAIVSLPDVNFNPEKFLRIPIHVLVGARDVGGTNLRRTKRVDAQQGKTRLERARRWTEAMRDAGKAYGIDPDITFTEVSGTDHSFTTFCRRGALVERMFQALFGIAADAQGRCPPDITAESAADDAGKTRSSEASDVRGG
jgi:pimeloyl-ACP methyl ester carboxylesterase